ncbi:MAG: hypothetical protein ACOY46_06210 [Bacillota bacterium]
MSKQKQQVLQQEILQTGNIEMVAARVKKDVMWVIVSVAVAVGAGLAVGNFFRF